MAFLSFFDRSFLRFRVVYFDAFWRAICILLMVFLNRLLIFLFVFYTDVSTIYIDGDQSCIYVWNHALNESLNMICWRAVNQIYLFVDGVPQYPVHIVTASPSRRLSGLFFCVGKMDS